MSDSLLGLEKQLCFPLYAASRLVTQCYRPILARYQLTYPQYLVMMVLWEGDGISVKDIASKLYLDSPTITPILKKLEHVGFIERKRPVSDDRQVLSFLTAKGRELRQSAESIPIEMSCHVALSPQFAQDLKSRLDELVALLASKRVE